MKDPWVSIATIIVSLALVVIAAAMAGCGGTKPPAEPPELLERHSTSNLYFSRVISELDSSILSQIDSTVPYFEAEDYDYFHFVDSVEANTPPELPNPFSPSPSVRLDERLAAGDFLLVFTAWQHSQVVGFIRKASDGPVLSPVISEEDIGTILPSGNYDIYAFLDGTLVAKDTYTTLK